MGEISDHPTKFGISVVSDDQTVLEQKKNKKNNKKTLMYLDP